MRKKTERGSRDSALASGWKVESDPSSLTSDTAAAGSLAPVTEPVSESDSATLTAPSENDASGAQADAIEAGGITNGALVSLGVFGGLYLLYVWGWFIIARAYSVYNATAAAGSGQLGGLLQQIVFWAAPLAPVLWFGVALIAGRGGRTKRLTLVLIIGAIVLLPLPMLIARGS